MTEASATRALYDEVRAAIQEVGDEAVGGRVGWDYAFHYLLYRTAAIDPSAVRLLIDDLKSMAVRLRVEKYDGLADTGSGPVRAVPIRSNQQGEPR